MLAPCSLTWNKSTLKVNCLYTHEYSVPKFLMITMHLQSHKVDKKINNWWPGPKTRMCLRNTKSRTKTDSETCERKTALQFSFQQSMSKLREEGSTRLSSWWQHCFCSHSSESICRLGDAPQKVMHTNFAPSRKWNETVYQHMSKKWILPCVCTLEMP
jgi:hypothetical protein